MRHLSTIRRAARSTAIGSSGSVACERSIEYASVMPTLSTPHLSAGESGYSMVMIESKR